MGTRHALALLGVCLAALMFGLEISSVPVILPTLEVALHGDFEGLQWIMNAYTIACTSVLMATGTLADRYGRRRVFLATIALFGGASLLCGLAGSMPVLIAGRLLQGASGGAMLICVVAVLSHQFPGGVARARAFATWGIVSGVGLGFGPIVGGLIVALASWRWVFEVHVAIAVVAFGLVLATVEESHGARDGKLDVAGIVSLSLAVLGLAFFVTEGAALGFGSVAALASIVVAVASLGTFVVVESRVAHPMFDVTVFRSRAFSGALVGSVGMNFSFWPFIIYLPIYFQGALGQGATTAGLSLLAYTLPTLVFPPVGERLAVRLGPHVVIPGGLCTIGAGFLLMRSGVVLPGCFVAGAGLGLVNTPVTNTTTGAAPSERAGMASGIDVSARMISLAVNIAVMGLLLVEGVRGALGPAASRSLASAVAAGSLHVPEIDPVVARAALLRGFDGLMLYAGLGVTLLAALSRWLFVRQE